MPHLVNLAVVARTLTVRPAETKVAPETVVVISSAIRPGSRPVDLHDKGLVRGRQAEALRQVDLAGVPVGIEVVHHDGRCVKLRRLDIFASSVPLKVGLKVRGSLLGALAQPLRHVPDDHVLVEVEGGTWARCARA